MQKIVTKNAIKNENSAGKLKMKLKGLKMAFSQVWYHTCYTSYELLYKLYIPISILLGINGIIFYRCCYAIN